MKNLGRLFLMPLAAFTLASAGAISTHGESGAKSVDIQGWHRVDESSPCTELRMCNNLGTTLCKLGVIQAYQKTAPNQCSQVLFHRN